MTWKLSRDHISRPPSCSFKSDIMHLWSVLLLSYHARIQIISLTSDVCIIVDFCVRHSVQHGHEYLMLSCKVGLVNPRHFSSNFTITSFVISLRPQTNYKTYVFPSPTSTCLIRHFNKPHPELFSAARVPRRLFTSNNSRSKLQVPTPSAHSGHSIYVLTSSVTDYSSQISENLSCDEVEAPYVIVRYPRPFLTSFPEHIRLCRSLLL